MTVGSGTSGSVVRLSVLSGRSKPVTEGQLPKVCGEGRATSSGHIHVRTANSGTAGISGLLIFSSGTASSGNSGGISIGTGAATCGR